MKHIKKFEEINEGKKYKSIKILNAQAYDAGESGVENGWQEVEIKIGDEKYILEFETAESPMNSCGNYWDVQFADKNSEKLAKKIGFKITDKFKNELLNKWDDYSNEHFRN